MAGKFEVPNATAWLWGLVFAVVGITLVFRVKMVRRWVTGLTVDSNGLIHG